MTHLRSLTSPRPPQAAGLVLLTALAFALSACGTGGASAPSAAAPLPVPVAMPHQEDVPIRVDLPAHVESIERVEVAARVAGSIQRVAFTEGARVQPGDLLIEIDPRPFEAALARARAALQEAEAQARLAEGESARAVRLLERRAISAEEAVRREAEADVAVARRDAARAELARARLDLEHTRVRAPIAGRMGRAELATGHVVEAGDRLALLVSDDPVYVRFDLAESALARAAGTDWRARFRLPELPDRVFEGELAFVDNEINAETGTLRVRFRLAGDPALVPGRYGRMELELGRREDALLVNETAIGADQGTRYVLVVDAQDTVQYRPVEVGARIGERRVIEQGLAPDDRIVVAGLMGVRPGMTVAPQPMPSAAPVATVAAGASASASASDGG